MIGGVAGKLKFTLILLLKQVARVLAYLWPRDRNLVAMGAWEGDRFGDSPKYFALYLLEHSDLQIAWIGKPAMRTQLPDNPRLRFVEKNTLKAMAYLLRAKTWICCISIEWDLTSWPIEGFATLINTNHGFGMKAPGNSTGAQRKAGKKCSLLGMIATWLGRHRRPWGMFGDEYYVGKFLERSAPYFHKDRILRIGTPNNDYLINNKNNRVLIDSLKRKMAKTLGFDPTMKIISYLPTWRNPGVEVRSFYGLDEESKKRWRDMLTKHHAVLIEKHHPRTLKAFPIVGESFCSIPISLEKSKEIEVQELLLISDIHISDYSGSYQDFGVLGRPCIHYAYDLEDYIENCSGFIEGWENRFAGLVVKTDEELYQAVERNLVEPKFEPRSGFAESCEYQKGHACEELLKFITK